jgi:hypothetical protein
MTLIHSLDFIFRERLHSIALLQYPHHMHPVLEHLLPRHVKSSNLTDNYLIISQHFHLEAQVQRVSLQLLYLVALLLHLVAPEALQHLHSVALHLPHSEALQHLHSAALHSVAVLYQHMIRLTTITIILTRAIRSGEYSLCNVC